MRELTQAIAGATLGALLGLAIARYTLSPPFGELHPRSHELMFGVPGSGKTHWLLERVRSSSRVVFFDPAGDLADAGEMVYAEDFDEEPELLQGSHIRVVVNAWDNDVDVADAFRRTLKACGDAKGEGGLVLVPDEVGDFAPECARDLTWLHRGGHKRGIASILASQVSVDIPLTCRRTATRVASLLQDYEPDLEKLGELYGDDYAQQVRRWRPGDPPVVWQRRTLFHGKAVVP